MKTPLLILALAITAGTASSQVTFTSSGTWTVPAGVTSITAEVVGAGGNGGSNGGGGGGGGGYASGTFTVVPATVYTITVGTSSTTTATSISGLGIQATKGANGTSGSAASGGAGGVGSGGTVNRTGGTGGAGTYTYFGGGGGGAAGSTANGGNGGNTPAYNGTNCLQPGGAAGTSGGTPGGAGGKGAGFVDNSCNVADAAAAGAAYGGGGGGGNGNSSPAANGSGGYVVINWCTAPAAPTGTTMQTFCSSNLPTVANLVATGTGIQWYAAATGGTPLAATTPLVNNTVYYASQTVSGCESGTRLAVTAMVTTQAAPTGNATQQFCSANAPTVAALTATGTGIKWYAAATGGTALAPGTPLVNNTQYYASQTVSGCESSTRLQVTATVITVNATATGASNVLTAGAVTGATYQWINCANNQPIANATAATYTATANGSYAVIVILSGCRDTSSCVTVSGVGVEELQKAQGFSLYPNPARNMITVQAARSLAGVDYSITDASGKKVKSGRLTGEKTEISIRDLPAGIYHFNTGTREHQAFTVTPQ